MPPLHEQVEVRTLNGARRYLRLTCLSLSHASNASDFRDIVLHAASVISGTLIDLARDQRYKRDHEIFEHDCFFFLSWTALAIYAAIALSLVLKQSWILNGVALALFLQVTWIALKWTVYALEDRELFKCIAYARCWLQRILKEGEGILKGRDATKWLMAGTVAYTTPRGVSYARALLRYKTHEMNLHIAKTLGQDRYNVRLTSLASNAASVGKSIRKKSDEVGRSIQKASYQAHASASLAVQSHRERA
jgi:hypothetical protein